MATRASSSRELLLTVPMVTFGYLRNYVNVRMGSRQPISWGEWNTNTDLTHGIGERSHSSRTQLNTTIPIRKWHKMLNTSHKTLVSLVSPPIKLQRDFKHSYYRNVFLPTSPHQLRWEVWDNQLGSQTKEVTEDKVNRENTGIYFFP